MSQRMRGMRTMLWLKTKSLKPSNLHLNNDAYASAQLEHASRSHEPEPAISLTHA